jgi:hypothetical protein
MTIAMPDAQNNQVAPERIVSSPDELLTHVQEALRGLQFGVVSIIVQDGVVVQIERTEKHRFRRGPHTNHPPKKRTP